jgi:hypothetical protein
VDCKLWSKEENQWKHHSNDHQGTQVTDLKGDQWLKRAYGGAGTTHHCRQYKYWKDVGSQHLLN